MACAYLYDRAMLERHGLAMLPMRHEDEEFTPRAIYFAKRIRYVPIRAYNYLQHKDRSWEAMIRSAARTLSER